METTPSSSPDASGATITLVLFTLDERRFALALAVVERVERAAEITALPQAPPVVAGLINIEGSVLPVFDLRARYGFPQRSLAVADHFILATTPRRRVVLIVDTVQDVVEVPREAILRTGDLLPGTSQIQGIIKLGEQIVFIHDLETFLSTDEEAALARALQDAATPA